MNQIEVSCPAKINLTLEIVNKRDDGFHNIRSIMQAISLYDYLTIKAERNHKTEIVLHGSSDEIPYDEKNLVYKACRIFLEKTGMNAFIDIYIDKHIPVSAGLAGGSTDAAGTLAGLNELFSCPLNREELHELASSHGTDLNVCLEGGCILAEGRGEIITKLNSCLNYPVTLIKPKNLGISAKEAYMKYSALKNKPQYNMTVKMLNAIKTSSDITEFLYNDLETAVFNDYTELQNIKAKIPEAIMSGSGSTYFVLKDNIDSVLDSTYQVINSLHFIPSGIKCTTVQDNF